MSFSRLYFHIIMRPKDNRRVLTEAYEKDLYRFIWKKCVELQCHLHRINGMPDHLHLLVELPTTLCVADFVKAIKVSSNRFLKCNRAHFPEFEGWGRSFCAFSYSKEDIPKVKNYIINQKVHHAKVSYEDELRAIFQEHGVEYKEEYLMKD